MRILLTSPYDLSVSGGVTSHVMDVAHQLRALGHLATVVGPARAGTPPNSFTHYIGTTFRFPSPGDNAFVNLNPLIARPIREFLRDQEFDVFHLHEPFLGFLGPTFLQQPDAVKVGTFHATRNGPHVPYAVFQPLILRWNRLLDGRIAVSETAKRTVSRYAPGEYTTIPNGIDFHRFATRTPPAAVTDPKQPTVLFVGRLEARKGVPYLLRAFAQVKKRVPRARLVIVGQGRERRRYEQLAARLGLDEVSFEGFVRAADLPAYYRQASLVCQPSTCNESFGITVLEGMAAGTPVVASSIAGFNDLVEPDVTGLSVPPKDAEALAAALERVLSDDVLAARLAVAGQEHARQYDWPKVVARLLAFYEECYERTLSRDDPEPVAAYGFPA